MSNLEDKEIDETFWIKGSTYAISYYIAHEDGEELGCLCIIDIETNEIKYTMTDDVITMQPLAIHSKTKEVRYLLVQKYDKMVLIDCLDFST